MSSVLLVISQRNFNDTEYSVTKQTLEDNEIKVTVSSITREESVGMDGSRVVPEKTVRETNPNEYDALIIIGGSGSPSLMDYPEVLQRVRDFHGNDKLIAAICLASVVLARAGVMKGVMLTVFPSDWAITSLKRDGAQYSEEHVVVDGNVVTADGPQSAKQFAEQIVKKLKG